MDKNKKFLLCAGGIFICYFYFGILQEKVTKAQYITEDGEIESFKFALSLVFFLCFFNFLVAKLIASTIRPYSEDTTKTHYYVINGITYVLAMTCTNMSLQFVSYPTQVIAKSCKPIPVLILGVLLGKRSYSWQKYLNTILVVIGVALFMYKDNTATTNHTPNTGTTEDDGIGFGELLLFLSLVMDGLNGAVQERMKAEHNTKPMPMMLNVNLWASIYLFAAIVATGELFTFYAFIQRHPEALLRMVTLSVASSIGQLFIFESISEYGPLPTAVVATVRKLFTVLTSVIFLGNTLIFRQWFATSIVFAALFLDAMHERSDKKKK